MATQAMAPAQSEREKPTAQVDVLYPVLSSQGPETEAYEKIAALAYEFWQARGCPYGSPEDDWFRAEKQLQARN
jgi:hypothetical protein